MAKDLQKMVEAGNPQKKLDSLEYKFFYGGYFTKQDNPDDYTQNMELR